MITEMGPLIVITGECRCHPGLHAVCVKHRTLPEIFGEGATAEDAAGDLVRKLMRECSSVSDWHLADLEGVIVDIHVFLDQSVIPSATSMLSS